MGVGHSGVKKYKKLSVLSHFSDPEARKKKAYLLVTRLSRMGTDMSIGLSVASDLPRNLQSRPHPKLLTTFVLA